MTGNDRFHDFEPHNEAGDLVKKKKKKKLDALVSGEHHYLNINMI